MLAYSSIGHAGYLLVAVASSTLPGASAMLFYLIAYTLATFGAFAVVVAVSRKDNGVVMIEDLAGLWATRPWLAVSMAVIMLSLLGFPIFGGAGFVAKWYVLQVALQSRLPQTMLAVVLVLTTVVSAGYYLHVLVVMFMRAPAEKAEPAAPAAPLTRLVLAIAVGGILILGVYPNWVQRVVSKGFPQLEDSSMEGYQRVLDRLGR